MHSTAGLTTAPRCSVVPGGQCSLNVPADRFDYRALIVTDLPNNPDLAENIDVSFHCSSNRAWAYAVVVVVPLLVVIIGVITTPVVVLLVCWRKRDSLRACCSRQSHTTQPTTTTEEEAEAASPTSAVQLQEIDQRGANPPPAADQKDSKVTGDSLNDGHLTTAPPPSYKASLDYPTQKTDLPPHYSKE